MSWFARRRKVLPRPAALAARPFRLPIVRQEELDHGRLRVTVAVRAPGWVRWLGGPRELERGFGLDPIGRELYQACDGRTDVDSLIRTFSASHHVGLAEAELSVTTFLRTLISRGLIAMAVDAEEKSEQP